MSIKRLLLLAGLLAVGACGTGPNAICAVDPNTEWTTCSSDIGTPLTVLPVPYDEPSTDSESH